MSKQKFQFVPPDWPTLRQVAEPVKDFEVVTLKESLYWLHKLRKAAKGAAIAAPQLGDSRRWFVWDRGLVINPEILDHGFGTAKAMEKCLSFPGVEVPIERYVAIRVKYVDENEKVQEWTLNDLTARVFQHELDHLNGICIDRPQPKR